MRFQDILTRCGLPPDQTCVILHTPVEKSLRRVFAAFAVEEPDLFDAYQNNHPAGPEATLKARPWLVTFVNTQGHDFVLIGVFKSQGWQHHGYAALNGDPRHVALQTRFGVPLFPTDSPEGMGGRAVFDLVLTDVLSDLRGRLLIAHKPSQSYVRLANSFDAEVVEITRLAHFASAAPDWRDFVVTAAEVRSMPGDWAARLREWRGVYLITDEKDGARYVGSAYGAENLLGRWRNHVAQENGVTVELKERLAGGFRFSILELLAPDADPALVLAIETSWKNRLHTRKHGLNLN